jgi:hypothetical protein
VSITSEPAPLAMTRSGDVDLDAGREDHMMIQDAEAVSFGEADPDPAFGCFGDPAVAFPAKRLRDAGGPARKILRQMCEFINFPPVAADGDADAACFEGGGHSPSSDVGREFGLRHRASLERNGQSKKPSGTPRGCQVAESEQR